jgi:hypothetical protein
LIGGKHSGKSTAASYLVAHHGFRRIALADDVKDATVCAVNGVHDFLGLPRIDRAYLDEHKDAVFVPLLQWVGSDYGREFLETPQRWIERFTWKAERSPDPVVCDDVRYVNEVEMLRKAGFLLIKPYRNRADRIASMVASGLDPAKVEQALAHSSETELEKIEPDIVINAPHVVALQEAMDWCCAFQSISDSIQVSVSRLVRNQAADLLDQLRDLEALIVFQHADAHHRMDRLTTAVGD